MFEGIGDFDAGKRGDPSRGEGTSGVSLRRTLK